MPRTTSSILSRYGFAIVVVLVAAFARWALQPLLGERQPFVTFYIALILSAWYGGSGPSLVTLTLGALSALAFFLPRPGSPSTNPAADLLGTGLFVVVGSVLIAYSHAHRAARSRLERAEASERQQRERLETTLASIGDAVLATDAEGRVASMNPVAEALTGWTQREALGKPLGEVLRFVHEQTRNEVEDPAGRALREGAVVALADRTVLIARDGSERAIDDNAAPIRNSSGQVVGSVLVFRDVDKRRRAERALAESEARKAAVLGTALDAIIAIDHEGKVVEFNPAAEATFGYARSQVVGREMCELIVPPSLRDAHRRGMARYLETGDGPVLGKRIEITAARADGTEFPVELAITRISGDGPPVFTAHVRDITERKRAEGDLRDSEQRFRGLMEQAPFSIQVLAPDGRTLRVNRAWEQLWGLTLDKLADYDMLRDPQLEAKGVLPHIRRAFAGEPVAVPAIQYDPNETLPDRTVHADPGRWVSSVAYPLKDAAGRVREVVIVHDDITVRRRAEEAIRESEGRFRHLADAMPQMVWVTRPDRSVEYVNRRWLDYTGQTQDEFLGPAGWAAVIHPEDLGRVADASLRAHAGNEPFEAEYRIRHASGTYRWHLGRSVPVFDESGRFVRRFGAATDIDDRKRVEGDARFLAEASATLASIVDEASTLQRVARLAVPFFADWCSVDLADEAGPIRHLAVAHIDPAKVELAHDLQRRYPPDPQARQGVPQVVRTGSPEMVAEITDAMILAGARDEGHLRILRELGLRSYLCVPLKGRNRTLGAITFVAAESGRRYGPQDLRLAEDLAVRAAIAVENSRLYSELMEADRRKNDFLATLAHELRNPLAPIRNTLHLMRGPSGEGRMEAERAMAERNVVHLARLIDDLMDVARINRGRIELGREVVDLGPVVRHAVETARPLIDERRHRLDVAVPEVAIRVEADATRLEQVLGNLLNNSAKYTAPGGLIRLSVEPDGGEVVVRVRDTGIGIRAEMLPKVFDMFVQVGEHRDHAQGGLGIGLSLVKTLVEMHGGSITANSDGPGHGCEFVVRLPLLVGDLPSRSTERGHGRGTDARPHRRRILVVDDNVDAARSLSRLLERLYGQDVRVAHDGPEALAAADEFLPQVVLLDIGLPGMDGHEVARRLRGRPEFAGALIVALTGWGQEDDLARSREAGFDHHLVKPADPDAIRDLLINPGASPAG